MIEFYVEESSQGTNVICSIDGATVDLVDFFDYIKDVGRMDIVVEMYELFK